MGKVIPFQETKQKLDDELASARMNGDPDELRKALPSHMTQPPTPEEEQTEDQ